jgi:hypothetical protein
MTVFILGFITLCPVRQKGSLTPTNLPRAMTKYRPAGWPELASALHLPPHVILKVSVQPLNTGESRRRVHKNKEKYIKSGSLLVLIKVKLELQSAGQPHNPKYLRMSAVFHKIRALSSRDGTESFSTYKVMLSRPGTRALVPGETNYKVQIWDCFYKRPRTVEAC